MAGVNARLAALIPVYQEEQNIVRMVQELAAMGVPVYVVDDGSKDRSAERSQEAGAQVLKLGTNHGKGVAIRRGLEWVAGLGAYDVILLLDGDGQHHSKEIPLFLNAVEEGADLVVGNRMSDPQGMPVIRMATNLFLSSILSLLCGRGIADSQCGYRAIRVEAARKLDLRTKRFEIESEMLLEAARKKLKISSVPIQSIYADEVSQVHPFRDTYRFFRFLFVYYFLRRKK